MSMMNVIIKCMYAVLESKIFFSNVPEYESLLPDRASQFSQIPERESQTTRKKSLIYTLITFSRHFKKSERSKVLKFIFLWTVEIR